MRVIVDRRGHHRDHRHRHRRHRCEDRVRDHRRRHRHRHRRRRHPSRPPTDRISESPARRKFNQKCREGRFKMELEGLSERKS